MGQNCDKDTGQCQCQPHVVGRRCTGPQAGYYVPISDANQYQPVDGTCQLDAVVSPGAGNVFALCSAAESVTFDIVDGVTIDHLTTLTSNIG